MHVKHARQHLVVADLEVVGGYWGAAPHKLDGFSVRVTVQWLEVLHDGMQPGVQRTQGGPRLKEVCHLHIPQRNKRCRS